MGLLNIFGSDKHFLGTGVATAVGIKKFSEFFSCISQQSQVSDHFYIGYFWIHPQHDRI